MWESISTVLISDNGLVIIALVALIVVLLSYMSKKGLLKVSTKHIHLGRSDLRERNVIREQCDWVHTYVAGLLPEIEAIGGGSDKMLYGGYFTKYILEVCYDEFVRWITFNHLTLDEAYVSAKQDKTAALVLSHAPRPEFRTPEFRKTMDVWVENIIRQCVKIREVYER